MFVSDGAGSATHSAFGSNIACETALAEFSEWLVMRNSSEGPTAEEIKPWLSAVILTIKDEASNRGLTMRDLACTFVGAIVTPLWSCYLQVGDGGIVIEHESHFRVVHWPDGGEYANQTHFMTDPNALDRLMFKVEVERPISIGLFSDGVQFVSLDYAKREPVAGFFRTLTKALRSSEGDGIEEFIERLHGLLNSDVINQRTDDDKTLVLCVRDAC